MSVVHVCKPCIETPAGSRHRLTTTGWAGEDWLCWPVVRALCGNYAKVETLKDSITTQLQLVTCPFCKALTSELLECGQLDVDRETGEMAVTPGD